MPVHSPTELSLQPLALERSGWGLKLALDRFHSGWAETLEALPLPLSVEITGLDHHTQLILAFEEFSYYFPQWLDKFNFYQQLFFCFFFVSFTIAFSWV